jgi:membrane dipeptidase
MALIIDAHEDLAWNMLTFGRDYRRSAAETRQLESNTATPSRNGHTLIGWPDYQRGQVGLVFSTLFIAPKRYQSGLWDSQVFREGSDARRLYHAQIDCYRRLADQNPDFFRLITHKEDLRSVLKVWEGGPSDFPTVTHPVGLVMLMEGAEGIEDPGELEEWWQSGVRILGPVWAGTRFCGGTQEPGNFTSDGFALLDKMAELGFTLDISHMTESSALQALDRFPGTIIASHANARVLLKNGKGERHFTDPVIRNLIERGGVMGVIPYNRFLLPDWSISDGRQAVPLSMLAAQIDYICQIAGDAFHTGLGTDFDGGFGWPSVPDEINTIADLQKLGPLLQERGYQIADIDNILGNNWKHMLERSLPAK